MEKMSITKTKRLIDGIFKYKDLNDYQYNRAFNLLNTLKDNKKQRSFYNKSMAKLLLKKGDYQAAKYYLLEEIERTPHDGSLFYHLFKVDVNEGNYKDAYIDLFKYKEKINRSIDISLPLTLLEIANDLEYSYDLFLNTDYEIEENNKLFGLELDGNAAILYNEVIKELNNRNYKLVKENLIKLDKIIYEENLSIDIKPLLSVIDFINNKAKESYLEECESVLNNSSEIGMLNLFKRTISNKKEINLMDILGFINKYIDIDYLKAKEMLENFKKSNTLDRLDSEITFLENRLDEKKLFLNLTKEEKKIYIKSIKEGRSESPIISLDAYAYYEYGKYVTNHPIFNYYIGELLYQENKYDEAKGYLEKYYAKAGEKKYSTLTLLRNIALKEKDVSMIRKYEEEQFRYLKNIDRTRDEQPIRYSDLFDILKTYGIDENLKETFIEKIRNGKLKEIDIFKCIAFLTEIDISYSKEALFEAEKKYSFDDSNKLYRYIKNIVTEKTLYCNLTEEQKEVCLENIKKGKTHIKLGELDEAFDSYMNGKKTTNLPIFDYHIGKTFFKNGNLNDAKKYFCEYVNTSGIKAIKTYKYLMKISLRQGRITLVKKYEKEINRILKLYNSEYIDIDPIKYNFPLYNDKDKDSVKNKVSKQNIIDLNEFEEETLDINLYDSYSVRQKLMIIKGLYQDRRIKTADKLMKELQRSTTDNEENKQIATEIKRKVLYINQNKGRIDKRQ